MYFLEAIYWAESAIGLGSIVVFFGSFYMLFDEKTHQKLGTAALVSFYGGYAFLSVPLAMTINGGKGGDILFWLGVTTLPIVVFAEALSKEHVKRNAAAETKVEIIPPPAQLNQYELDWSTARSQPLAAPTTLDHDFDVPPQR